MLERKHKPGELVDSVDRSAASNVGSGVPRLSVVPTIAIYLAHPYSHREIGTKVQHLLEAAGVRVTNPFDRPEQAEIEKLLPNLPDDVCNRIVTMDLEKIREADTIVAILVGDRPVGTTMEILYNAVNLQRVTFSLVLDDYYAAHPWIRTLTRIHRNVDDLVADLLGFAASDRN